MALALMEARQRGKAFLIRNSVRPDGVDTHEIRGECQAEKDQAIEARVIRRRGPSRDPDAISNANYLGHGGAPIPTFASAASGIAFMMIPLPSKRDEVVIPTRACASPSWNWSLCDTANTYSICEPIFSSWTIERGLLDDDAEIVAAWYQSVTGNRCTRPCTSQRHDILDSFPAHPQSGDRTSNDFRSHSR